MLAARHHAFRVLAEQCSRIVAVDVFGNELESPLEGPNNSITITSRVLNFAAAHPFTEQFNPPGWKKAKNSCSSEQVILKLSHFKNQARTI